MKWCAILLLILTWAVPLAGEPLEWPLRIEIKQSSSFAEYRGLRFHAGIDLKTQGTIGHPVHAIADGFVSRLKVQHRGAGNSVYLDHPGAGVRSLYAHLDRFAEPMASYIAAKQAKTGSRYGIDDSFGPDRFPVKKGQIIGYSGETGLGPPHLHFELRRFNDHPISPAMVGLIAPDTSRPEAFHVHVDPLSPETVIDGGFRPVTIPLTKTGPGRYVWKHSVHLAGRAGLHVGIIDHGEGGSRFGVDLVRLMVDGQTLFERRFQTFSYDHNPQCPYVYDHHRSERPGTGFVYTLFRWPHDTTPFAGSWPPWAGVLDLAPGTHQVAILVADFAGNEVTIEGTVVVEPALAKTHPYRGALAVRQVTYHPMAVIAECTRPAGLPAGTDAVAVTDDTGQEHLLPAIATKETLAVAFPIDKRWEGGGRAGGVPVLPPHRYVDGRGGEVAGPDGFVVRFPPGSLNLPVLARVERVRSVQPPAGKSGAVLQEVSPVWWFSPDQIVTGAPAQVVLPFPEGHPVRQLGIYRWRHGRAYSYLGGSPRERALVCDTRVFAPFLVVRDAVPPRVKFKGTRTVSGLGPCLVFAVADEGEGIDWYAARATLGDRPAEVDSDPDKDELYILTGGKPVGKARVALQVFDQAGNMTAWTGTP
ncbi:MAG: hypothetical protein OZSIB_4363 [Candidatus Ozemobacter sibiricus]|uniref:M23ase beta-sheet core domain-containing protein n=1 Tax=Candidatus Ozemobacter sibiricus TaxID=2268124 RepID=A0A367ZC21_9BACT|nr:MAG: hypothetical protein OZSIB_4363 [Candidatus Ozemobacter sibiricus]